MLVTSVIILSVAFTLISLRLILNSEAERKKQPTTKQWVNKLKDSVVDEFPTLGVKLSKPILNSRYYFNGKVPSISEHEQWVAKKFGKTIPKETEDEKAGGRCIHWEISNEHSTFNVCVVFVRDGLPELHHVFIVAHEEFHVAQYLKAKEVFDAIYQRLLERGYCVNWDDFSFEQQAHVAGILTVWECGLEAKDTLEALSNHANLKETYEKLQRCKIS